jgi:hypothetical protein
MAPLTDPDTLKAFREALREWRCDGYVVWKRRAGEWLAKNLDDVDQRTVSRMMQEHVESGGKIDQVVEKREEWRNKYEYHYDVRFSFFGRRIYIETVLDVSRTGPTITVVNMHDECKHRFP